MYRAFLFLIQYVVKGFLIENRQEVLKPPQFIKLFNFIYSDKKP